MKKGDRAHATALGITLDGAALLQLGELRVSCPGLLPGERGEVESVESLRSALALSVAHKPKKLGSRCARGAHPSPGASRPPGGMPHVVRQRCAERGAAAGAGKMRKTGTGPAKLARARASLSPKVRMAIGTPDPESTSADGAQSRVRFGDVFLTIDRARQSALHPYVRYRVYYDATSGELLSAEPDEIAAARME